MPNYAKHKKNLVEFLEIPGIFLGDPVNIWDFQGKSDFT